MAERKSIHLSSFALMPTQQSILLKARSKAIKHTDGLETMR